MQFSPLLALHIAAGVVGILSGTAAMTFRKGSPRHAQAGKVFVVYMLIMSAAAVYLAVAKHQTGNILGGAFTFLLLAAAGDLRMLLRGGLFGTQRILRHLWRMCFGLFIATGSFFLGQGAKVFPSFIANSNVLFIPALLPLLLLIFWVIRVRLTMHTGQRRRPVETMRTRYEPRHYPAPPAQ